MLYKFLCEKMSYSLLCGPLCGIYDYSSRDLANTIFTVSLRVREELSSFLSRGAWQKMEAEHCMTTSVLLLAPAPLPTQGLSTAGATLAPSLPCCTCVGRTSGAQTQHSVRNEPAVNGHCWKVWLTCFFSKGREKRKQTLRAYLAAASVVRWTRADGLFFPCMACLAGFPQISFFNQRWQLVF